MILRNSFRPWQTVLGVTAVASLFTLAGCPSTTDSNSTSTTPTGTTNNAPGGNEAGNGVSNTSTGTGGVEIPGLKTVGKTDPVKLAVVTNNASDYWTICQRGVEKADQELANTSVEFQKPANGTVEEQQNIIKTLLTKQTQGIAISPKDPENETQLLNDTAAKALVVTQDSDAPKSNRAFYIGTDNLAAGKQAGEEIKKVLPKGGTVVFFVGTLDAQNAADRKNGIVEALKSSPDIKIGDTLTDETDRLKAKSNASSAILKAPAGDLCLVGLWSYNGPQILSAVKDANKVGQIKIVCFDEEDETLEGVKSGAISATIVQNPYEFGYQSVKLMDSVLRGDSSKIPANRQIVVPTRVISKDTVDAFRADLNKKRGR